MIHVGQKTDIRRDYCAVCGHEIEKGHIFILARIPCPIGREIWRACHLSCFARMRQRQEDRQIGPALPLPAAEEGGF